MKKVSLFSTALAVIAGLSIAESNANAAQRSNNNTNDVNEVGSLVYSNAYGQDYVNDAHSISVFKDSNGRYGIGQGTTESTMYYKINNDGKTMTVWRLASKPGTLVAQQKYITSTISLSSLGFNPDSQNSSQTTTSLNASSTQGSSASQTSSSATNSSATTNKQTTQTSSANNSAITSPKQTPAETKRVAKKASKNITVPSSQGKQTLSYYKVAALVYAKAFGADRLNEQSLQLTMNKNHSRSILGDGTPANTILFRVNQGKKTVTVWAPNNNDQSMTKTTYDISALINEFYATDAQQSLINQTAQSLKK